MGRLIALALLLVFSSELIQPLLASALSTNPEQQLPACCRRNGKHGCNMNRPRAAQPSVRGVCSEYQVRKASPVVLEAGLAATPPVTTEPLQPQAPHTAPTQPAAPSHNSHTHAGRGPPSA